MPQLDFFIFFSLALLTFFFLLLFYYVNVLNVFPSLLISVLLQRWRLVYFLEISELLEKDRKILKKKIIFFFKTLKTLLFLGGRFNLK